MSPKATAEAFAQIKAELDALSADAVQPFDLDPVATVHNALAAAPKIQAFRDAIVEDLPKHPIEPLDNLESYALAAWYAHLVHTYASSDPETTKAMLEEATKLRDGLLIAAEALAHRDLLDADVIAKLRKSSAQADLAGDLVTLAALFTSSWGRVSSKTAVERHEVDRAAELGPAVMVAQASKKGSKGVDTTDQRSRAFTLLTDAYDSCRRALTYLRWKEGDADSIAPSLTKKRPGRKPKKEAEPQEAEAEGEALTDAP